MKTAFTILLTILCLAAGPRHFEPKTQDGPGIMAAIKLAQADPRGEVYLAGVYQISDTLDIARLGAVRIAGASPAAFDQWAGIYRGAVLRWVGPPGKSMIRLNSQGSVWENVSLDGAGKCSNGITFVSPSRDWVTGQLLFRRVWLGNFTNTILQAGESRYEVNCADVVYDQCIFWTSPCLFRSLNDQALNHHFRDCGAVTVGMLFDIQRGGALRVTGGSYSLFSTLIRTGDGGPNTGTNVIRDVRLEPKAASLLIDAPDSGGGAVVSLENVSCAIPADGPLNPEPFRLGNNVIVNISGGNVQQVDGGMDQQ